MTLADTIRHQQRLISEAKTELDHAADDMARALLPRLRLVGDYRLAELKKALRDYDAHCKFWKR